MNNTLVPAKNFTGMDNPEVHLYLDDASTSQHALLTELRAKLESSGLFSSDRSSNHRTFLDDRQLLRFLTARKFDVDTTFDMIQGALEWRNTRNVEELATPQGVQFLSKEGEEICKYVVI